MPSRLGFKSVKRLGATSVGHRTEFQLSDSFFQPMARTIHSQSVTHRLETHSNDLQLPCFTSIRQFYALVPERISAISRRCCEDVSDAVGSLVDFERKKLIPWSPEARPSERYVVIRKRRVVRPVRHRSS